MAQHWANFAVYGDPSIPGQQWGRVSSPVHTKTQSPYFDIDVNQLILIFEQIQCNRKKYFKH